MSRNDINTRRTLTWMIALKTEERAEMATHQGKIFVYPAVKVSKTTVIHYIVADSGPSLPSVSRVDHWETSEE